jgi:geranylgeranyl diphosphate synthase type II
LDVYADKEKFGKQVGGDIISNKKTFLLLKAKALARGTRKEELEKWIAARDFNKDEKVRGVTEIYDQIGIKSLAENKMQEYFDRGFEQFAALNTPQKAAYQVLLKLTQDLVNREK